MKRYTIPAVSVFVLTVSATALIWLTNQNEAEAHCQVPCGIYDDPARIASIREDRDTIAKAIAQINLLAGRHDANSLNQAVRWVTTKDDHASHIIDVVSEYFLTQKVKPAAAGGPAHADYLASLAEHHAVMVAAMKTKQSADTATVTDLSNAINKLALRYPAAAKRADAGQGPVPAKVDLANSDHRHTEGEESSHSHGSP